MMPLLQTKLYVPPVRREMVSRPRLMERLNAGLEGKLTLISAPAGFGKTTLLGEWIHARARDEASGQTAWLSLDEDDNDPACFMAYVIAALQSLDAHLGGSVLAALQSPQPSPLETLLAVLVNDLARLPWNGALENLYVLVLDDYHAIKNQSIHQAMAFLLDHLPRQVHLVLATRSDPPLPLARLRGRGQLNELRTADLRFTAGEAAAFLNQAMGLGLSASDVASLEARTEGWITGLQLAAISLLRKESQDRADFLRAFTGSHRYVLDYLLEEVLDRETDAVQAFLLETSILERLSSPLCEAVTGNTDAQAMLEGLDRDNLFLMPLDGERRWYRYHRLFADLLRSRLGREQATPLHRRASTWYENNGFTGEAIGHSVAAQDFKRAARLVEASGMAMLMRGEMTTLLRWLAALPEALVVIRPWLNVYYAWALLLTGQVEAVEPRLAEAETAVGDRGIAEIRDAGGAEVAVHEAPLLGHVAAIRAYLAGQAGDIPRATALGRATLELLPHEEGTVRSVVAFTLGGIHLLDNDLPGASQAFAEASRAGQRSGNLHVAVSALCRLGDLEADLGRLHKAAEAYQDALRLATGPDGQLLPVAAQAFSGLADLFYERNDLVAAERHLLTSIDLDQQWGNANALASIHCDLARLYQAKGEPERATDALQQAERLMHKRTANPLTAGRVAACRARLELAQSHLAEAARWRQESGLGTGDEIGYLLKFEYTTLARVLAAQGEHHRAAELLARLLVTAQGGEWPGHAVEVLALQALILQIAGDVPGALATLERALSLAEPEGYMRTFIDEGEPMARLLLLLNSQGSSASQGYLSRLLDAFGIQTQEGSRSSVTSPALPIELLSERELEVLRLVAEGLTNREIAAELVIAVSTVKSHTNSIFGKLGVKNRTQAVALARGLDLL
jgi:LuxR family maltose regulon positive regulatory protein